MSAPKSSIAVKRAARTEQPRLSRQDWIDGAIRKLSEDSVAALRVDELAEFLNVTKGSFYWHFQNREELLDAVLLAWRTMMTTEIQEMLGKLKDTGLARLRNLMRIAISARPDVPGGPFELTLRDWARRDPQVAKVVREVDEARINIVAALYREAGLDAESAQEYSMAHMSFVIGARTAFATQSPEELARRRKIAETLFVPALLTGEGR
jgi:AcrR family transcriptional regulator